MPKAVVLGGSGYVGLRLGRALAGQAGFAHVLLLDREPPPADAAPLPPGAAFAAADVRDEAALARHFRGAALVLHCASYGMSGSSQLQRRLVEEVNVGGTRAVLRACVAAGVERLVYLRCYSFCLAAWTGLDLQPRDRQQAAHCFVTMLLPCLCSCATLPCAMQHLQRRVRRPANRGRCVPAAAAARSMPFLLPLVNATV